MLTELRFFSSTQTGQAPTSTPQRTPGGMFIPVLEKQAQINNYLLGHGGKSDSIRREGVLGV